MPLYEFECQCGKISEDFFRVAECPDSIDCECGKKAKKILSMRGGIQTDNDVTWLPSAVDVLQPDYEQRITTRTEYKKYLKEKGLQPIG